MTELEKKKRRNIKRYKAYAQHRDKAKLTDYYISTQCGVSKATLSSWKHGGTTPKVDVLMRICRVLNITLEQILVE